jgi:hypothetical protein
MSPRNRLLDSLDRRAATAVESVKRGEEQAAHCVTRIDGYER